jgi:regulator of protease activity HflC (stomatin/prohibitin superfamily)
MKKQLLVASIITAPTIALAGTALAGQNGHSFGSQSDQYAEKLATRFNLNKEDVSTFMTEQRQERRAQIESKAAEALKAAGFSESQIAELQAKKTEQQDAMKAWREANPNATREEMKAQRDKQKTEFETWAKDKGIDLSKVRDKLKGTMPKGRGHDGPKIMNSGDTPPSDTQTN